ncbi:reverse transcriptase domain-containing protein, partial [Anaerosolibacter sp.]|uniref:reverse transcriptase domain-containing protein n=1 Tax=Anaerosolibacter sp. TaxID=1872527 RepID=UPI0039F141B9
MNDNSSMACNQHESISDKRLSYEWDLIDWTKANQVVNRIQIRIAKAAADRNWNLIKRLQYLLTNSFYAKALAVKRITSNTGKRTAGVDGILWNTKALKMKAIRELRRKGYQPLPLKRIYIDKPGKSEKRPLSIPTMIDRAMQALYLLALEPIAETMGDRISFGFRKYRSTHDAMEYIFKLLSKKNAPQWIIEGDIKGCFDNINHQYLLDNIPMDKNILKKFISAGYLYKNRLFPNNDHGTPQGGIISPTLANMTLDGMENVIATNFWTNKHGKVDKKHHNTYQINLVRYADDFIATTNSEEKAYEIKNVLEKFMTQRGLTLSNEKTSITHIDTGFN